MSHFLAGGCQGSIAPEWLALLLARVSPFLSKAGSRWAQSWGSCHSVSEWGKHQWPTEKPSLPRAGNTVLECRHLHISVFVQSGARQGSLVPHVTVSGGGCFNYTQAQALLPKARSKAVLSVYSHGSSELAGLSCMLGRGGTYLQLR